MSFCRLDSVSFSYPDSKSILENFSIEFNKEERIGIVGRNGIGKTTLIKLMLGILKPQSGRIYLKKNDIRHMSLAQVGQKIGYCFQNPDNQLFAPTAYEQIAFGLKYSGFNNQHIAERADYWLNYFEISNIRDSFVFNLSRGQKQRVILAAILSRGTDFFIMDEPTTGLDIAMQNKLSKCLKKLADEKKGFIIISHDKAFIEAHIDRAVLLKEDGSIKDEYI